MTCSFATWQLRSTRRYWKKIFQNLLDIAMLNSWILFNFPREKKMGRDKFILAIVEAMCSFQPQPRPQQLIDQPPQDATHEIALLDDRKEKDCFVCSDRSKDKKSSSGRKRTRYWCPGCKVGCHPTCSAQLVHVTDQGSRGKGRGYNVRPLYFNEL